MWQQKSPFCLSPPQEVTSATVTRWTENYANHVSCGLESQGAQEPLHRGHPHAGTKVAFTDHDKASIGQER